MITIVPNSALRFPFTQLPRLALEFFLSQPSVEISNANKDIIIDYESREAPHYFPTRFHAARARSFLAEDRIMRFIKHALGRVQCSHAAEKHARLLIPDIRSFQSANARPVVLSLSPARFYLSPSLFLVALSRSYSQRSLTRERIFSLFFCPLSPSLFFFSPWRPTRFDISVRRALLPLPHCSPLPSRLLTFERASALFAALELAFRACRCTVSARALSLTAPAARVPRFSFRR